MTDVNEAFHQLEEIDEEVAVDLVHHIHVRLYHDGKLKTSCVFY